jgi:hypothetical protein
MALAIGVAAGPPVAGDEISDEAFVSWKAVVDKVSRTGANGHRVKAKLDFRGRTSEGNQIRGTGKLRFVGDSNEVFAIGDQLRGSDSLKYWATVTSMMGDDLAMIEGTGILDLRMTGGVLTIEGAIDFKAALEIYNGG